MDGKLFIVSIFFVASILFMGLEIGFLPFTSLELVVFFATTGGISMLLMIPLSLLFGSESRITTFSIGYAWFAISLMLIFLSIISAIFVIVVLLLLYREGEVKEPKPIEMKEIDREDRASESLLVQIGNVIEEHTNYHLAPTLLSKILTVVGVTLLLLFILLVFPYFGVFLLLLLGYYFIMIERPFTFNYEHSYLGERGYIRLERENLERLEEIKKEEFILFDEVYSMKLSSKIECSKHLSGNFSFFDKEKNFLGKANTDYNDMVMSIEERVTQRLYVKLKDKKVLFELNGDMLVNPSELNVEGIYFIGDKMVVKQGVREYPFYKYENNKIYTNDGTIFFVKNRDTPIVFQLDDFVNTLLLLKLIVSRFGVSGSNLLNRRFRKETICNEGGGGGGG